METPSLSELRKLSDVDLRKAIAQQREAHRELAFRVATLEHKNPHDLSALRLSVARGETLLRERAIALVSSPAASQAAVS